MKLRRDRHKVLQNRPQGEWCPDAVGVVPGYPRTPETFAAQAERLKANRQRAKERGLLTRLGVPNGWAGKKDEIAEIRRNSQTEAERLTEAVFEADCWEARVAMTEAMKIALSPFYRMADRLVAMRLILQYTVPRPAQRVALESGDALGFLRRLAEERQAAAGQRSWA
jgi:hypothetical protein